MDVTSKRHVKVSWPFLIIALVIVYPATQFIALVWSADRALCAGYERILSTDLERLRDDCRVLCQHWQTLPGEWFDRSEKVLDMVKTKEAGMLPESLEQLKPRYVRVRSNSLVICVVSPPRLYIVVEDAKFDTTESECEESRGRQRLLSGVWLVR
jgi:hypothetical protein